MIGRRLANTTSDVLIPSDLQPGDYVLVDGGSFLWFLPPSSKRYPKPHVAGIDKKWELVEEKDGTITVSPSIQMWGSCSGEQYEAWHGFLKNGVWSEA